MPDDTRELFATMTERYRSGNVPWAAELPPPEIIDLVAELPSGRALDLGCGLARACIYLAGLGWRCDGVDFVPEAIEQARQRVVAAGVDDRVSLHLTPVTELDFLDPPYDLAIDVGCLHAQPVASLPGYARQLRRLLRPGGAYILFTHLRDSDTVDENRWATEAAVRDLFRDGFVIDRVAHGSTVMPDATWPSAWFWMRRTTV